jgi:hypothetical protein
MSWSNRAAANLLPLSFEKADLARALKEWRYTGHFHDLETPSEDCELCDHPDIRYQFEIQNLNTSEALLIGSECINRFGIAATDEEGKTLDAAGTKRKVARDRRRLIDDAKKRSVISSLVALSHADQEFSIGSFIDYLQTRGAFTPNQLAILMWRLKKFRIAHNPCDFKLTIKRNREKAQLRTMQDWKLRAIEQCMTPSQKEFLARPHQTARSWEDDD